MLEIANLSHTYANGTVALDDVSLSIPQGHVRPARTERRGQVDADAHAGHAAGSPIVGHRHASTGAPCSPTPQAHRRRARSYLPQEFGVYPARLGRGAAGSPGAAQGLGRPAGGRSEQVIEARCLQRTNLHSDRRKAVDTFSGGMRRRFGIAQALLGDPAAGDCRRAHRGARPRGAPPLPRPPQRDRRARHRRAVDAHRGGRAPSSAR